MLNTNEVISVDGSRREMILWDRLVQIYNSVVRGSYSHLTSL